MTDTSPTPNLESLFDHWFVAIDDALAAAEVPLAQRPFDMVIALIKHGAFELKIHEEHIDLSQPWDHVAAPWFRILYSKTEKWYVDRYGAKAMRGRGNPPLLGVTLVQGAPFALKVPMHRTKIVEEGRLIWMYFEAGIGEGETPANWVVDPPSFSAMDEAQRSQALERLGLVSERLRRINFSLLGAGSDAVAAGFKGAIRDYLEKAAQRIIAGGTNNLGPAWFDLQMAIESALKLAHQTVLGRYPHTHDLARLFQALSAHGIRFDIGRLDGWPPFAQMSDMRYAQGAPPSLSDVFNAYLLTLDAVVAALSVLSPALNSGAGFLLRPAPWLTDETIDAPGKMTEQV